MTEILQVLPADPIKVHIVQKIARQYEGENIFIFALECSTDRKYIENYVANLSYTPAETINGVECVVEIGVLWDIPVKEME